MSEEEMFNVSDRLGNMLDKLNRHMVEANIGTFCFFCGLPSTEKDGLCYRCSKEEEEE